MSNPKYHRYDFEVVHSAIAAALETLEKPIERKGGDLPALHEASAAFSAVTTAHYQRLLGEGASHEQANEAIARMLGASGLARS